MLLRAIVESAREGIILSDSSGTVQVFNPACEALFGYVVTDVVGRNITMLVPSLDSTRGYGSANAVGRRKDGSVFPLEISRSEASEHGIRTLMTFIRDRSEAESAEQALKALSATLEAIVGTAPDGVIVVNEAGTILSFNPACERLFGYLAADVIGDHIQKLLPPASQEEYGRYLEEFQGDKPRRTTGVGPELEGRRGDGSMFPMILSVGRAEQADGPVFVTTIHDLTDRKRTEAQLVRAQKMQATGQLSSGIAHDFNNLLTVIIGNADALSEELKIRPDLSAMCDSIMGAGDRGAELTSRLMKFSKRQDVNPAVIDCNALVEEIRALLRPALREDIELKTSRGRDPVTAFADRVQLESALLNLAMNAQDAMPRGGCLTMSTAHASLDERSLQGHPEVTPGEYIAISVTDNGEGMPAETRERAFEPFFTTKESGKGTGLGLSMVHRFIRQSNGHVSIESEPGMGTTVSLYLPALESAAQRKHPVQAGESALVGESRTVLVVEDDFFVRGYATSTLESLGYRVITAVDGPEALSKLNQGLGIEILFSDVVMPGGINGWELAEQAQEQWPKLEILLTSGYAAETLTARGGRSSNLRILSKPYRKADLARRLRELQTRDPA